MLDGSNQKATATRLGLDLNCFAPSVRHSTHKCLAACAQVRPSVGAYPRRTRTFDVEGAYLQGELEEQVVYARPPPGYRTHTRGGTPIVWRLTRPLYGEACRDDVKAGFGTGSSPFLVMEPVRNRFEPVRNRFVRSRVWPALRAAQLIRTGTKLNVRSLNKTRVSFSADLSANFSWSRKNHARARARPRD